MGKYAMEVKSTHRHPFGRVDVAFLLELQVGELLAVAIVRGELVETDGMITGVTPGIRGLVLLAGRAAAQPTARPIRHRPMSSVLRAGTVMSVGFNC
jgi:hypothetical protein